MDVLYFRLTEAELQLLPILSQYEKALLSSVVHTLRLGVYIAQRENGTARPLEATTPGAVQCEKYIQSALSSGVQSDKLFPLRQTGQSMQFILQNLPTSTNSAPQLTSIGIFQICIWRAFAFGNNVYMEQSKLDPETPPDLDQLASMIQQWGQGAKQLPVPAYGQLQIIKANAPKMLSLFWDLSQEIFFTMKTPGARLNFADLHGRLASKKIPSLPRYGLIGWLLISDFFEYGICEQPTVQDLAEHIMHSGASGPRNALAIVAEETGQPAPADADELSKVLTQVFGILREPPKSIAKIGKVVDDCEEVQARALAVVDLEHALCKIARQDSRAKVSKLKRNGIVPDGGGSDLAGQEHKRKRGRTEKHGNPNLGDRRSTKE